jgi:hypothetical protein
MMRSWLTPFERSCRNFAYSLIGGSAAVFGAAMLLRLSIPLNIFGLAAAAALLMVVPELVRAICYQRLKQRMPALAVFSISLSSDVVDDAPQRMEGLIATLAPHLTRDPVMVAHSAQGEQNEAANYDFLFAVTNNHARIARQTLNATFNGRGARVRKIKLKDSLFYAPVVAAFEREDAARATQDAARGR